MATKIKGTAEGAAVTTAVILRAIINEVAGQEPRHRSEALHRMEMSVLHNMSHPQTLMDAEAREAYDAMFAAIFPTLTR